MKQYCTCAQVNNDHYFIKGYFSRRCTQGMCVFGSRTKILSSITFCVKYFDDIQYCCSAAMLDLLVITLKNLLLEELYPATAAAMHYHLRTTEIGLNVMLDGFNQKIPVRIVM